MIKNILYVITVLVITACGPQGDNSGAVTVSSSGANRLISKVPTNSDGHTLEQLSVASKLQKENVIGGIQYVYVISPFSGEVILQDTAQGKVSSSGKRNTPKTVVAGLASSQEYEDFWYGPMVDVSGETFRTNEVMGDDGTYGDSSEYLYWTSTDGTFHRQYITAGVMIHVSDRPCRFGHVTQTLETTTGGN